MHLCLHFFNFSFETEIQKAFVNGCYLDHIEYDEARKSQVGPLDPVAFKDMHTSQFPVRKVETFIT